jgi:hypothetical protein
MSFLQNAIRDLFSGVPARFASAYVLHESIERLRSRTKKKRSTFAGRLAQEAVGEVSAQTVVLQRVRPFFGNSFRRVFVGQFRQYADSVVLEGKFAMPLFARVFMGFWFGFGVLCVALSSVTAVATAVAAREHPEWSAILVTPFFGVAILALGYLGTRPSSRWSRADIEFLSDVIAQALGSSRTSAPADDRTQSIYSNTARGK